MLGCGGGLSYISIDKHLFTGDLIFIGKFFMGLLMLITIGFAGFFLFKFRLLLIKKDKLISFNPFILRYRQFDIHDLKGIKWSTWELKATVFRTLEANNRDGEKLTISDFEFENFNRLISMIPKADSHKKKVEVDFKQAKSNLSFMTFTIWINLGLVGLIAFMNISGKGYHWIHIIFYSVIAILIYASQKRRIRYKRIIKTASNF